MESTNRKAAAVLKSYVNLTPLVLKALPEWDAPSLTARAIHIRAKFGSIGSIRSILRSAVALGIATSERVPVKRGTEANVYKRTALPEEDNLALVYGEAAE